MNAVYQILAARFETFCDRAHAEALPRNTAANDDGNGFRVSPHVRIRQRCTLGNLWPAGDFGCMRPDCSYRRLGTFESKAAELASLVVLPTARNSN